MNQFWPNERHLEIVSTHAPRFLRVVGEERHLRDFNLAGPTPKGFAHRTARRDAALLQLDDRIIAPV